MSAAEPEAIAASDPEARTHLVQLPNDFAGGAFLLPDGRLVVAALGGTGAAIRLESAAARELADALHALVQARGSSQ